MIAIAFVLSAAMLAYEIVLTRMASVLLTNQYTFLVLGMALLGIAAGAICEYAIAVRHTPPHVVAPAMWLASTAMVLALTLVILVKSGTAGGLLVLGLAAALPFAMSGAVFARLFRLFPDNTGSLYAADFAGAAAGALLVPVLLPAFGPIQTVLFLSIGLGIAGAGAGLVYGGKGQVLVACIATGAVSGLLLLNQHHAWLGPMPVGNDTAKDLTRTLSLRGDTAEIVESRWSTFGRTDLVRFKDDPDVMSLFIDGAAGTGMLRFDGDFENATPTLLRATREFGGIIPLLGLDDRQKDHALIIGPGGGRDVLLTLMMGFKKITAVEINPQIVEIVKAYGEFNGGIYSDYEHVEVVVAEGRHYLRHSDEQYDLIMLLMPVTKSSRGTSAFALSENYLFTTEAFRDYHRRLTDEGSLVIMAHGMTEIVKIVTTALRALQEEGVTVEDAMSHLYVLGSSMMPLFGLQKTPLQKQESMLFHTAAHDLLYDSRYSYVPGVARQLPRAARSTDIDTGMPMMSALFLSLAEGKLPLTDLERGTGLNFVPARDDQPFFFHFEFVVPTVVLSVFWLSLAVLIVILIIPARHFRSHLSEQGGRFFWGLPLYITAIGLGYIVIELALLQKLVFYLGDPSRSLALLLASLLVGSGVGSFLSRKAYTRTAAAGGFLSAAIAAVLLLVLPNVFNTLHDTSFVVQQGIAAGILFLQGVPMGCMFPIGLRVARRCFGTLAVPWMWSVNGCASVVGCALAIGIAMASGYTWTQVFGATSYLVAGVVMLGMSGHVREEQSDAAAE